MSACISAAGEFSEHVTSDTGSARDRFLCVHCFATDEEALLDALDTAEAERDALQLQVDAVRALCDEWEQAETQARNDGTRGDITFIRAALRLRAALSDPEATP